MTRELLDFRTRRGRTLVYVSDVLIVLGGVLIAISAPHHHAWRWGPFILGPLVGVLGIGVYVLLLAVLIKVLRPDPDELRRGRELLRQRRSIVVLGYVCVGLCLGCVAGRFGYWPDVLLGGAMIVFGLLLPLALLPLIKRKAETKRRGSASAA